MRSSVAVSRSSSRRSASPRTTGSSANSPKARPRQRPRARSSTGIRSSPAAAAGQVLEARGVQVDEAEVDGVAGAAAVHERIGRERAPQAGDVALQRGPGRLGRLVLPQRFTEPIDADLGARGRRRARPAAAGASTRRSAPSAPSRRTSSGPSTFTATAGHHRPLLPGQSIACRAVVRRWQANGRPTGRRHRHHREQPHRTKEQPPCRSST